MTSLASRQTDILQKWRERSAQNGIAFAAPETLLKIPLTETSLEEHILRSDAFEKNWLATDVKGPTIDNVASQLAQHQRASAAFRMASLQAKEYTVRNMFTRLATRQTQSLTEVMKQKIPPINPEGGLPTPRNAARHGFLRGLLYGAAVGLAANPAYVTGGMVSTGTFCEPFIDGIQRSIFMFGGMGYAGFVGLLAGGVYGAIAQKTEVTALQQHPAIYARRERSHALGRKGARVATLSLIAGLAFQNVVATVNSYQACNWPATKIDYTPPSAPSPETLSSEAPLMTTTTDQLVKEAAANGYAVKGGEFVYGLACGEGMAIAQNGMPLPTSQIPYGSSNLHDQFLKDNPSISDINVIPKNGSLWFRDMNGDGKLQFTYEKNWNCTPNAKR